MGVGAALGLRARLWPAFERGGPVRAGGLCTVSTAGGERLTCSAGLGTAGSRARGGEGGRLAWPGSSRGLAGCSLGDPGESWGAAERQIPGRRACKARLGQVSAAPSLASLPSAGRAEPGLGPLPRPAPPPSSVPRQASPWSAGFFGDSSGAFVGGASSPLPSPDSLRLLGSRLALRFGEGFVCRSSSLVPSFARAFVRVTEALLSLGSWMCPQVLWGGALLVEPLLGMRKISSSRPPFPAPSGGGRGQEGAFPAAEPGLPGHSQPPRGRPWQKKGSAPETAAASLRQSAPGQKRGSGPRGFHSSLRRPFRGRLSGGACPEKLLCRVVLSFQFRSSLHYSNDYCDPKRLRGGQLQPTEGILMKTDLY